ncbi:MAG: class I SAM-dependent methyltransferase [Planctomycetota bacterium]
MKPTDSHSHNRSAWDALAKKQDRLAKPARDEDFSDPLKTVDGSGWLGDSIHGKSVLCLAAGGGRQGPIYAAAGAAVTVVDISPAMLQLDREVAAERNIQLRTVEASMDDLRVLSDGEFDIVIHPVSTCYVPDLRPVYLEVSRVLRAGGIYVSQHKQPASLQATVKPETGAYRIVFECGSGQPLPVSNDGNLIREDGTLEWAHSLEMLLGTMCRAGLTIEDIVEPQHAKKDAATGSFGHRARFVPPYVRVKARKRGSGSTRAKLIV